MTYASDRLGWLRPVIYLITFLLMLTAFARAQTAGAILPNVKPQFLDNNGVPVPSGQLCTYDAGTSNFRATYVDSGLVTQNANPVILDASGRPSSGAIYLSGVTYKFVLYTASTSGSCPGTGALVWSQDNIGDIGQILKANLALPGASTGAAMVGFQQIGANALTNETAQAKMRQIVSISDYAGTGDFGLQAARCVAALAGTGGICDASSPLGAQTCTTNITFPANTMLRLGGAPISGTCQVTMGPNTAIVGGAGVQLYPGDAAMSMWTYTGSTGNFITVPDHAVGVVFRDVVFLGNLSGTSGHGLYSSPGANGVAQYVTDLTLDHASFDEFKQDGVHLEDNVFMVRCLMCGAKSNGNYGWYQAKNLSAFTPDQVWMFAPSITRNAVRQIYSKGGKINISGGDVSDETSNVGTTYCIELDSNGGAFFSGLSMTGVHMESCGGTAGGAYIYDHAESSTLAISSGVFFVGSNVNVDAVLLGATFAGKVYLGPGDDYGALRYYLNNQAGINILAARLYDDALISDKVNDTCTGAQVCKIYYHNDTYAQDASRFGLRKFTIDGGLLPTPGPPFFQLRDGTVGAPNPDKVLTVQGGDLEVLDAGGNDILHVTNAGNLTPGISGSGVLDFAKITLSSHFVAFAALGAPTGANLVWCSDCTAAAPPVACAGAGGGAWAFSNGLQWTCPF